MKRVEWIIVLGMTIFLAVGCGGNEVVDATTQNVSVEENKPLVIHVATVEDFIKAIGPNRTIELEPGDYVLSKVPDRYMDYVRWDKEYDGNTVTLRKLSGLAIRTASGEKKPARLLTSPRYAFVLKFENCSDIVLENLVLGHWPDKGTCTNGVVGVKECKKMMIRNCDLFGCGTEGLSLENVQQLKFENSIIRDCSYGILSARGCRDLSFTQSQFIRNYLYGGFSLHDSKNITFTDCVIKENVSTSDVHLDKVYLFNILSCSNVVVTGGEIGDNKGTTLIKNPKSALFKDVHKTTAKPME